MTSEQHNEPTPATNADEDLRCRCMQYLLGELPASELAAFEKQLADSPKLHHEMLAQSELICAISAPAPLEVSAVAQPSHHPWRLVALVSALAATFLITVIGLRWQRNDDQGVAKLANTVDQGNDEALLIARAWAANHVSLASADVELNLQETEFDFNTEPSQDEDSALSWMVVAVADEPDLQISESGGTTDG